MQQQVFYRIFSGLRALALLLGLSVAMGAQPVLAKPNASPKTAQLEEDKEVAKKEGPVGLLLGEFFIRDRHESENAKTRISFSLYASVAPENEKDFAALLARHQSRVRDTILTAIRLSDTHDFQEPSLSRLKLRMLLRLRRGVSQLKIEHLHFRRFEFFID